VAAGQSVWELLEASQGPYGTELGATTRRAVGGTRQDFWGMYVGMGRPGPRREAVAGRRLRPGCRPSTGKCVSVRPYGAVRRHGGVLIGHSGRP